MTIEPIVEVEYLSAALELAARGVGDVLVPSVVTRNRRFPPASTTCASPSASTTRSRS